MKNSVALLSLSSSRQLATEISDILGIPLREVEVKHFADGEIIVEPVESVRGDNVYIIQSTCAPVSSNLMEILIAVDACRRASAKEINVIIPYFGYARQDRKAKPRQPITARLVADLLQVAGIDRVITMDLHASQIQGFFNVPIDDMTAMPLIGQYFRKKQLKDTVVVSPDHGGVTRARRLAETLQAPLAIIDKRRPKPNVAEIMNIVGDVKDKTCILIDDMVDTGGTIVQGAKALKERGAKEIYIACTHAVFSGAAIERLQDEIVKEVVITNTIELPKEKHLDKIKVLSVASLLSATIDAVENAQPVSDVFSMFEK